MIQIVLINPQLELTGWKAKETEGGYAKIKKTKMTTTTFGELNRQRLTSKGPACIPLLKSIRA